MTSMTVVVVVVVVAAAAIAVAKVMFLHSSSSVFLVPTAGTETFRTFWHVIGFSTRCGIIVGHLWYTRDAFDGVIALTRSN